MNLTRLKNRAIARAITRFPQLAGLFIKAGKNGTEERSPDIPWTPVSKPLSECTVALVTTGGIHHRGQEPFDMDDPDGDPSFRVLDSCTPREDLTVTHDYYDHSDADRDINIVYPVERLKELEAAGVIGRVSDVHLGFMGHITGPHVRTLTEWTAPEAAGLLRDAGADVALLVPG